MNRLFHLLVVIGLLAISQARAADEYPLGPDSQPQDGVPKGELIKFSFEDSKIFPGTTREVVVYIPAQYQPSQPACLYVNQDGVQWNAPTVFDNLIQKKEMPVTIGVFVMHGRVKAPHTNALDRFNRSYEYDGLGDHYARFLIEELLPEVERKRTGDGRIIRLSRDPNDRAIGGASSGAICAFTAAWERPDSFRRVFSAIGTYVGLRGGHAYSTLVRKFEPKPLRVFLQDGENDLNIYAGDWWISNLAMERSLTFAGYEVTHVWGDGAHNGKHGTAVFPDAMRWLWLDWPKAVEAGKSKNAVLADILIANENWKLVDSNTENLTGLAATADGEVLVSYGSAKSKGSFISEIDENASASQTFAGALAGIASDGARLSIDGKKVGMQQGEGRTAIGAITARHVAAAHNGNLYATEMDSKGDGKVWLIPARGNKRLVDTGLKRASGITLSPDQTLLYVGDAASHWIYSYQIGGDGSLNHKQRYFWLHVPDADDESGVEGLACDTSGRLYAATSLGIQICDQPGRVNAILPLPQGRATQICFGGKNLDTLYALCGDEVFFRKLNTRGAPTSAKPSKPAVPRL